MGVFFEKSGRAGDFFAGLGDDLAALASVQQPDLVCLLSQQGCTAGQDLGPVVRGGSAPVVERPTCRGDGGRDVADG